MIKRSAEMNESVRENMRGGDGSVIITDWLEKGEYNGKARLLGTITLNKGCSIGEHLHENEEEIFFVISGEGSYLDNGKDVALHAGDSCICLGGEKHGIRNSGESPLVLAAVILTY